jgi:type II secretory pathway pseudopilin PulG
VDLSATTRLRKSSEQGYVLVAVMLLLALLVISMAVAVPRVRESIQRDKEVETMHRGMQYRRAIQLYFRKFHAYPPNVDALVKTNEIRFLRKRYTDPLTGKDDWKPILFGQNKAPLAMGFFGQPLAGAALAGTGPGGVNGASAIGSSFGSGSASSSGSSTFGGTSSFGGSSFSSGSPASGSTFGSTPTGSPAGATGGITGGTTPGAAPTGSSGSFGSDSSNGGTIGSTQTFGGGGIIGFSPATEKQSILIYKKKDHFNEWEFVYSPLQDQAMMQGGNAGTIGTPVGGQNGTGTQPGSGGFMSNPGGMTPTPTAPTSPQQ